jgi:hypothetical protein
MRGFAGFAGFEQIADNQYSREKQSKEIYLSSLLISIKQISSYSIYFSIRE